MKAGDSIYYYRKFGNDYDTIPGIITKVGKVKVQIAISFEKDEVIWVNKSNIEVQ